MSLVMKSEPPLPPEEPITPPSDPCKDDSSSLACCFTKTISEPTDACCAYDKIYNEVPICEVELRNNISISCRKVMYKVVECLLVRVLFRVVPVILLVVMTTMFV